MTDSLSQYILNEDDFPDTLACGSEMGNSVRYEILEDEPTSAACDLCPEGLELQTLLVEHLQEKHTNCKKNS